MPEFNIDPDQHIECTDYFGFDEWRYFQSQLNTVGRTFKQLAKEYNLKNVRDSRWPTRGIQKRKWGIKTTLTVELNSQYIDQSKPDYKRASFTNCI